MADHNKPTSTSLYADFVTEMDARFDDLAMMLDPANTTVTNPPTNAVRWNSGQNKFQKWNGSTWADLSANYVLSALTVSASGLSVTGSLHVPGGGGVASNEAFGTGALASNTTGNYNTASGGQALYYNTTGYYNTASGGQALRSNTTGYNNTASGMYALYYNTTGYSNTASGVNALHYNTTGYYNTANGYQALRSNTTGNYNTASGMNALYSNTTGYSNTASGVNALFSNTTGNNNVASGMYALYYNTTGYSNTASGVYALHYNTTGSGNTAINPMNSVGVYSPVYNPTTENDRFCMGSTGVTNAYIQVAWTVVSDARDKTDFAPVPHGLDFVTKLQPTAYRYKADRAASEGHGPLRYGFKAQDVLELEGHSPVIVDAEDTEKLRFNDQALLAVLVNAIKELKAEFDAYKLSHP